jgi:hypothetical protein
MDIDLKNKFVEGLDDIYKTMLIYRTIIVCNDDILEYKKLLEKKDFSIYLVNTPSNIDINYDSLDSRIILINVNILDEFLNNITSNKLYNFYTIIAFAPETVYMKETVFKDYCNYPEITDNII